MVPILTLPNSGILVANVDLVLVVVKDDGDGDGGEWCLVVWYGEARHKRLGRA